MMNRALVAAALLTLLATTTLADSLRSDKHLLKIETQTLSATTRQFSVQVYDAASRNQVTQLTVMTRGNTPEETEINAGGTRYQVRVDPHGDSYLFQFTADDGTEVIDTMRGGFTASPKSRPAPPTAAKRAGRDIPEPTLLRRIDPVYTEEAKAAGAVGAVVVELLIDKSGFVKEASVVLPMGHGLSESAIDAVKQWQFAPSMLERVPVEVAYEVRVEFRP